MSMSVEATVGAAVALENANVHQQVQMTMLRKTLDMQAQTVTSLIESAAPKLATHGMVGTQLHTTA